MQIALFGATGGTGRQVLEQAVAAGHNVTLLVRDPAKIEAHSGVTLIHGDVLDQEATSRCVQGSDAVICVLGSGVGVEPVEAQGTQRVLEAMQANGVRRLIAVTSLGVGDSREQVGADFQQAMDTVLQPIIAAKTEQERLIRASGLDWTIVRPGGLGDGPRTGDYRSGTDPSLMAGLVSRADVAEFVLRQLTDASYLHQCPAVT
ncbi:NAD(P)-dependent oxidoreductase [Thiocapsa sp. UBA6158]|jgi:putative NADH-flavin reductase|uniref:NAD(P)-dependent oxidoreductase n=1 Tax=Thiocapsa sp. UBA6158 TaxID=1947692 RepID=UPI0025E01572|nr:NAD(P)-binding oxidoreductase [Thiocapsa sp. UBA6158]